MSAMAVFASSRFRLSGPQGQAMDTRFIALRRFLVAPGAADRLRGYVVVRVGRLQITVTTRAAVGVVAGAGEFAFIDIQGNGLADCICCREVFLAMAIEALLVRNLLGNSGQSNAGGHR